jgi:hypothetical protein
MPRKEQFEARSQSNIVAFNKKNKIKKGEYYDLESQPSLTIPDQALSIKELLKRFTRGGEVKLLQPQYIESDELDVPAEFGLDLNQMDQMERLELLDATKASIAAMQLGAQKEAVPVPKETEKLDSKQEESTPKED